MKAVICTHYGPPEVLRYVEAKKPVPKKHEVLVRVMATAVNSGDVRVRGLVVSGWMRIVMRIILGFTKPRNPILGSVLSGTVESVGNQVTLFKPGDEVYAMTGFAFGSYAEYITIKETGTITLKPKKATFEQAAAILFGGTTAFYFLHKAKIEMKPQKKVLIYGATGSVGTAAIQIAKHYDAQVTAVCSQEGKDLVTSLGADAVVVYTKEDFTKSNRKYDIIFDAVGKTTKKECVGSLAKNGTYLTVGGLDVASETKEQLVFLKNIYDNNEYRAVIDRTYTLENIVDAHRYVDTGRKKGNVVIVVSDSVTNES